MLFLDLQKRWTHKSMSVVGASLSLWLLSGWSAASAHDFWLQPEEYSMESNAPLGVDVFIGHPEDQMRWPLSPERVIAFRSVGSGGVTDHQSRVVEGEPTPQLTFKGDGLHWLTIETQDSISTLGAKKFNDYVADEGLKAIALDRTRRRAMRKKGVERYSRRGKALVAIGDWRTASADHVTRPLGLTLELVPQTNPMDVGAGEPWPLTVHYRGQALAGATVKQISIGDDTPIIKHVTDANGQISPPRPEGGAWVYHVIWSTPLPDHYDEDYDTIFSSLSVNFNTLSKGAD